MLDFIDPVTQTNVVLLRLLVAALLGGLIGMERERSASLGGERRFAGVRTFPLFALLGAGITLISGEIGLAVVAGFLAVAALAVGSHLRTSTEAEIGTTTETAALATYWIGVIAGAGALLMAGALGVVVAALLAGKERLQAFPRALTREELQSVLTLAVLAVVILPVLPNADYGPFGSWNPRRLWLYVVLVSGLSFVAFVGMRFLGAARGLYVTGLLGGLVSSTATTVSFAGRSKETPEHSTKLAVAGGMASLVMLLRVAILISLVEPTVLPYVIPFLVAFGIAGGGVIVFLARRPQPDVDAEPKVSNPFQLTHALRFAALIALVFLVVNAANEWLGTGGLFAAAILAGLADLDAITLSMAGLAGDELTPRLAAGGIAAAALSNAVAKTAYATWLGSASYRKSMFAILGAAFVAGLAALLILLL